jgi:hypothetical protein
MNAVVQSGPPQLPVVTTRTNRTDLEGTFRCVLSIPAAVADHGRIVLGGGFRLPTNREST